MKKYTLEIYNKETKDIITTFETNNLKRINKELYQFFYTTLGTPTSKLLNYKWSIIENETNDIYTNYWPDKIEITYNRIMNADPDII